MGNKLKLLFKAVIIFLIIILLLHVQSVVDYVKFTFFFKNDLIINLYAVDKQVGTLSEDPSNKMFLRVEVRNSAGNTIPGIPVNITSGQSLGEIYPKSLRTNKYGEALAAYIPPASSSHSLDKSGSAVNITARVYNTTTTAALSISLIKPPVVLIHGYQEHSDIFDNMKDYLSSKGFDCVTFDYQSENGVVASANQFNAFLQKQKSDYLLKGIQISKFDIIAHSMGGLVARYYTCGSAYLKNNDVNKIIFVSVPHRGSYWATIGINYFNDEGIKDLMPESTLFSRVFPGMLNKGLNRTIQVGSILGQYDEVVAPESASLDEWNIKTEIFNVGENNLTMDNLLNGNILEASNHKNVLFNKKVFEKIEEMLNKNLPYPTSKNN